MPIVFDISAFFEYYSYCKAKGLVKINFNKAINDFKAQKIAEKVGAKYKTEEEIYLVPTVTGEKGTIKIGSKKFYQA